MDLNLEIGVFGPRVPDEFAVWEHPRNEFARIWKPKTRDFFKWRVFAKQKVRYKSDHASPICVNCQSGPIFLSKSTRRIWHRRIMRTESTREIDPWTQRASPGTAQTSPFSKRGGILCEQIRHVISGKTIPKKAICDPLPTEGPNRPKKLILGLLF